MLDPVTAMAERPAASRDDAGMRALSEQQQDQAPRVEAQHPRAAHALRAVEKNALAAIAEKGLHEAVPSVTVESGRQSGPEPGGRDRLVQARELELQLVEESMQLCDIQSTGLEPA